LHRIALAQTVPQAIAEDEPERVRILELASCFAADDIQLYYQIAIHGRAEIELAPDEYAGFTMTLLRMLAFSPRRQHQPPRAARLPEQAAQPVAQAVVEVKKVIPAALQTGEFETDWSVLLRHLNVQAMAQQLAKHCVMESITAEHLVLRLAQEHKHLQTRMATDNLQAALSDYFSRPVKLSIVLGNIAVATPAKIEQESQLVRQQQARVAIEQDAFVIDARKEFSASVVPESIKHINQ
jgi:DNA polymerase-3 subunit gamma/tau